MRHQSRLIVAASVLALLPASLDAARLTPGDILISSTTNLSTNVLREFTPSGTFVQTFSVPVPPGGDSFIRGVAADASGNVQIYNGTFSPYLTTLNPIANTYSNHTFAGWSTVNGLLYGGIAIWGNTAYLSDMQTAGDSSPAGIVAFDLSTFSAKRIAPSVIPSLHNYSNVSVGQNGLLYATWSGDAEGNEVDTIAPFSGQVLKSVRIPVSISGVTADKNGNIFGGGILGDANLYEFDPNGNILNSVNTGYSDFASLAISNDGTILAASDGGEIVLTNTSLTSLTTFSVGAETTTFAGFVTPLSIPEPGTLVLAIPALFGIVTRRRAR